MIVKEPVQKKESIYESLERLGVDTQSIRIGNPSEKELEEIYLGVNRLLDDWKKKLD
jgi:hypothetical protein